MIFKKEDGGEGEIKEIKER